MRRNTGTLFIREMSQHSHPEHQRSPLVGESGKLDEKSHLLRSVTERGILAEKSMAMLKTA